MKINLSVIIPAYNAADWLPKTIPKIENAIENAGITNAEVIIVDDGSSDDTSKVANVLKTKYPLRVISQKNGGRFLARKKGLESAKYSYILFIDTRVFIDKKALQYIVERLKEDKTKLVWNAHVNVDKTGNMYARFWDALTFIAWRKYFANPRDCSYGIEEFDYYPKGTTCFFVPKEIFSEACSWFSVSARNLKISNDDTLVIRRIAKRNNINLSPNFSCIYHARGNLEQFLRHARHRGMVFVDGFLRRDGNRFFWPLIMFLILCVTAIPFFIIFPKFILHAVILLAFGWILELCVTLFIGVPIKDALSFFALTPLFAIQYGLGIWTAVFDMCIKGIRKI